MVLLALEGGGVYRCPWERLLNRILSELVIVMGWVKLNNSPRNTKEHHGDRMAQYVRMGKEKGLEGNGELEGEGRRVVGGDFNPGSQGRGR